MRKITSLLLVILPLLSFGQITNNTFDSDISGWNTSGSASWSGTEGNTSVGSAEFVAAAGNNFRSSPNSQLSTAGDYTVNFWVKGTVGTQIKAQVFGWIGGNPFGDIVDMTGDWVEYTYTFTGCQTGINGNIRIVAETAGTFYIDDAYFTYNPPAGNTLTVNVVGAGDVNLALDQISYAPTDVETLTAVPATHWSFDSWGGDLTGTNNPETLLMDSDKTVDANFVIDPSFDYAFTFDTDGDLEGWTTDPNFTVINHTGGFVTLEIFQDEWSRLNLQGFPIPSGTYNKVSITLTNDSLNDQLDLIVVNGSTETLTHVMPEGDTSVQTYEYNLTTFTNWTGDVDYVRIRVADLDNPTLGKPLHNGLIIIDDIVFSYDPALSNKDVSINEFSMYPNPSNGQLNISCQGTINEVEFFDITGKQVMSSGAFTNHTLLNVSQLNQGIYLVRLTDENNNAVVKKLVIK